MRRCCGAVARQTTPDDPIVIGAVNGTPAVLCRVNLNAYGRDAYTTAWFTGDQVATAVTGGTLTLVDG